MAARSRLTSQGRVSVPARIRRKLGAGPGSVLEWDDSGEQVVVRRVGRYSFEDIHRMLFKTPPARKSLRQLKNGIEKYFKDQHARGRY
jgi:AbrB family looped-hinge helix DNA binding protein